MEDTIDPSAETAQEASRSSKEVTLRSKRGGLLGVKAGMTQIYTKEGDALGVTVIDLKPVVVTQLKPKPLHGYSALQVGFLEKKNQNTPKAEKGHLRPVKAEGGFHYYQEFRGESDAFLEGVGVGDILTPEFLQEGDFVDLRARSKGKGFQGGVKRYHMRGGNRTHGASVNHRSLGSIGNRADPSKCFKNKKMAGQMGNKQVTVQRVKVVKIDWENRYILVHGSVPGAKHGIVQICKANRA